MNEGILSGAGRPADPHIFDGLNGYLAKQVRPEDRVILDIGCGDGGFGQALKMLRIDRIVYGTETDADAAAAARHRLDAVHAVDIETELPPIAPQSLDCIILADVLERLRDPVAVLRRLKALLRPGGRIVSAVANAQHVDTLASIIAGDIQYQHDGPLDRRNLRLFGAANIQKLFLDAGLLPALADAVREPLPQETLDACGPLLEHLKLNPGFFAEKASVRHYICAATPMAEAPASAAGITFIVAVNNIRQLRDNLLASPILNNARHEIVPVVGATSAADALMRGLGQSARKNGLIVLLHQDVYLPAGWDDRLIAGILEAERSFGPVGVAGVFGVVRSEIGAFERAGRALDRRALLATPHRLPAQAESLDEIVLVFPVQNGSIVGLAPTLGFHMYGSEACLAAWEADQAAVIVDAPCLHNTESGFQLDNAFVESARTFTAARAASLPYATTCVQFKANGEAVYW